MLLIVPVLAWAEPGWFQKQFFPKDYWQEQVKAHQESVDIDRAMIRDSMLEIKKLHMTAQVEIDQAVSFAALMHQDAATARVEATEKLRDDLENEEDSLRMWKELLIKDQKALENAKAELAKQSKE